MDTTLHMRADISAKISLAAGLRSMSRSDLVVDLIKKVMDDISNLMIFIFFPSGLLDGQFRDIEEPHDAVTVSIDGSVHDVCAEIIGKIVNGKMLSQSYIRSLNLG